MEKRLGKEKGITLNAFLSPGVILNELQHGTVIGI